MVKNDLTAEIFLSSILSADRESRGGPALSILRSRNAPGARPNSALLGPACRWVLAQPHRRRLALDERGLTNTATRGIGHLAELVKRRLRACQQQNDLLAGFFTSTGITLELEPPR